MQSFIVGRPKAATGNEEWKKEAGGTRGQTARLQIHSPATPLPRVCCHQGGGTEVVEAEPSAACGSSMGVCLETAIVWEKCLLTWVCFPVTATKTCVATQGCREVSRGYTQFSPCPALDAAPCSTWECWASAPVASTPLPRHRAEGQSCCSLPIPDPPGAFWKLLTVGTPN